MTRPLKPELLSPVGGWPQLRAAIESGADAVYFGLTDFSARARATNFSPEELPEVMKTLHARGVKGFVALNTLIFDDELSAVADRVRVMSDAGVDAVIVQDAGVVRLMRELAPELPVHGSTQMTITSAEGCTWAAGLGMERVVLARELSIAEIKEIAAASPVEIEVFVHGALCVSYSGQCFSSEAWGGRSANRGQCAQACRLPYDLILDGKQHDLGDAKYLLSPQDLMAVEQVPELIAAGVACFKIEGRLKGPEYVAATTAAYRRAIDLAMAGQSVRLSQSERHELEQVFSRGLTSGFLEGTQHQVVVAGRSPRHRGVRLGTVTGLEHGAVKVALQGPVKRGDGVVFDAARAAEAELGGKVFEVFRERQSLTEEVSDGEVWLTFSNSTRLDGISVGDWVWRNRDEALDAEIRARFEHGIVRRETISATVTGAVGEPLQLTLRDEAGHTASAQSEFICVAAANRPLDATGLRSALERLGDTPFTLGALEVALAEPLFVPVSALNDLRRRAAEGLLAARVEVRRHPVRELALSDLLPGLVAPAAAVDGAPELTLLARTPEQVTAALAHPDIREIYLDFLEVLGLKESIAEVKAAGRRAVAVTPRVLKPNEERIHRFFLGLGADALLIRSLGMLQNLSTSDHAARGVELYGDFSLNASNHLAAELFLGMGLTRLAPTHDLNAEQLVALAEQVDPARLELIVHHHLPIFHTEHCVFARFLSTGNSYRDCGRPCEHHAVHLGGRDGKQHRVHADIGCRNTVFNAQPQSGADRLGSFVEAGYRRFRIELVDDAPETVVPLIDRYLEVLRNETAPADAWRLLQRQLPQGITAGSLAVHKQSYTRKTPARTQ